MATSQHERLRGRLWPWFACAAVIHAAALATGSFPALGTAAAAGLGPAAVAVVNVDLESPAAPQRLPGGGSPNAGESRVETARPPALAPPRRSQAAAPKPASVVAPPRGDRISSTSPDAPADSPTQTDNDPPTRMAAMQASDDRRRRDMGMAAAAASAGAGPGASGGPSGFGAGWGAPAIRGSIAFGNGSRGGLTGRVCFVPAGTLRIADVRECEYVATVYTDTLNIPERHFSDGFPGVTDRSEWFLIEYTGTFSVTGYGTYVFRLHSDDGSYLYIDDDLIIDNDGKHAPESRSGRVALAVGQHRIKVRYAQTTDRMALQLFVRTPQGAETIFTTQL